MRTQVAIIGGGPAGSLLSHLLAGEGIDSIILERRSREYVLSRIRAGVLEFGTVQLLREAGLGERLDREGIRHDGLELAFQRRLRLDLPALTGRYVTVYGQTKIQQDLYDALDRRGSPIVFEAERVAVRDVDSTTPYVTYVKDGREERLDCLWVAGCDGSYGVSRSAIPARLLRAFERVYPFGWLGVLSQSPPVSHEVIYAGHDRGFALCSMRRSTLSRYYVQCATDTDPDDWSDDQFWDELRARLPKAVADALVTGPIIERSVTPLRSFVSEPMRYGRLLLAGDAAHVVPPTGAKGLNLAVSDVLYLYRALTDALCHGSTTGVDGYSETALARVWKAVRFSWWLTTLLHRFPAVDGGFERRIQQAERESLHVSEAAQEALAENYVGLPLD